MHMHMNSKCMTLLQSITYNTPLFIIIAYICTSHKNRLPHVHRTGMMCNTHAMTVTHILHDLRGLHFRPRILRGHPEIIICVEIITCMMTTHPSGCWTWPRKIHASADAGKITVSRRLICIYLLNLWLIFKY